MESLLILLGSCLFCGVAGLVVGHRSARQKYSTNSEKKVVPEKVVRKHHVPALFLVPSFTIQANRAGEAPAFVQAYENAVRTTGLALPEGQVSPDDLGGEFCANMMLLDAIKRLLLNEYFRSAGNVSADGTVVLNDVAMDNLCRNICGMFTWLWQKSKP